MTGRQHTFTHSAMPVLHIRGAVNRVNALFALPPRSWADEDRQLCIFRLHVKWLEDLQQQHNWRRISSHGSRRHVSCARPTCAVTSFVENTVNIRRQSLAVEMQFSDGKKSTRSSFLFSQCCTQAA